MGERDRPGEVTQPGYKFEEIEQFVKGMEFTTRAMRAGVIVGGKVLVEYLGMGAQRGNLQIGFREVTPEGDFARERAIEEIRLSKKYKYDDPLSSIAFRMRAAIIGPQRFLKFFVQSSKEIKKEKTYSITYGI